MTGVGSEAFGELRSLLNASRPSRARFTRALRLCAARWAQAPAEVEEQWLPYAESHLEGWPDALRALDVSELSFDPRRPEPWMGLARRLSLSRVGLGDQDVDAIGLRTVHTGLRALDLSYNDLTMLGGRRLARLLGRVDALESLDLSHNWIGWDAARVLIDTLAPTSVREVKLRAIAFRGDGSEALIGADMSGLSSLEISNTTVNDVQCAALIESGLFDELEELSLVDLSLAERTTAAFAGRSFARLRALDLSRGFFHLGRHAGGLASLDAPALESFTLQDTFISEESAETLVSATWFQGLKALDLSGRELRDGILRQFVDAGALRSLVSLELSFAKPSRADLVALAREACALERITLGMCALDDWGVVALCEGDAPIMELDLSSNARLGARAMRALSRMSQERELRALTLRGGSLDLRAARALEGLHARELDLSGCHLGDRGVVALCEAGALDALDVLTLRDNAIGPVGAAALAARGATLDVLDVSENPLGRQGREALVGAANIVRGVSHPG